MKFPALLIRAMMLAGIAAVGWGARRRRVAAATGFRDPERMRRAFIRAFGQPPQSLRRAARTG